MDGGSAVTQRPPTAPTIEAVTRRVRTAAELRRELRRRRLADEDGERRARNGQDAPPPERGRHGKLLTAPAIAAEDGTPAAAGAQMRVVQRPIDRYRQRDQITARQAQGADHLRDDYEFGICGAHDRSKSTGSGGAKGYADLQLDAATRYRKAVAALGPRLSAIVVPVVVGDAGGGEISVGALAKARGEKSEQHLMGAFKIGLDVLADHYGLP